MRIGFENAWIWNESALIWSGNGAEIVSASWIGVSSENVDEFKYGEMPNIILNMNKSFYKHLQLQCAKLLKVQIEKHWYP